MSTQQKKTIGIVSLGCDKNRVDLEKMATRLSNSGYSITTDLAQAQIAIINTCAFIQEARMESITNILQVALRKGKNIEKIIVTGCLNGDTIDAKELQSSLPEVDVFVKISDNDNIVNIVNNLCGIHEDTCAYTFDRMLTTPNHYAYLKIADGCNNFCSYCTIPYIRGRFKSVPLEDLICEAKCLVSKGVKEIILVAQDVTKYGKDFNDNTNLVTLIRELSKIDNLNLIRLLYCYPDLIDDHLINEIANNSKVAKYIDMPLQHINNEVLKKMNRRTSKEQIIDIINKLRTKCPNITIRSTFILGFPGETRQHFEELCDFIKQYKLDNVGFFKYSREPKTRAYDMLHQVASATKQRRLDKLAKLQYENVIDKNTKMIGKIFDVIVDEVTQNEAICRAQSMCPQVDPVVYIYNTDVKVGQTIKVKIIDFEDYDLVGEIL